MGKSLVQVGQHGEGSPNPGPHVLSAVRLGAQGPHADSESRTASRQLLQPTPAHWNCARDAGRPDFRHAAYSLGLVF